MDDHYHRQPLVMAYRMMSEGESAAASSLISPTIDYLNKDLVRASVSVAGLNPQYVAVSTSRGSALSVLDAPMLCGAPLRSVRMIGWNKRFGDSKNRHTVIGEMVRHAKRYDMTDRQPEEDAVIALATLACMYVQWLMDQVDIDVIAAVPSSPGSTNTLPASIVQFVSRALGVSSTPAHAIIKSRSSQQLKSIHALPAKVAATRGMISADPSTFAGRTILLIDDLLASGTTIREIGRSLRMAQARAVYGLALVKTREYAWEVIHPQ